MTPLTTPAYQPVTGLALYALSSAGDSGIAGYWAGYWPHGSLGPSPTLDDVWQDAGGTFIFAAGLPGGPTADFQAGVEDVLAGLGPAGTVRFLWLSALSSPASTWQAQWLPAAASGSGPSIAWTVPVAAQTGAGPYGIAVAAGTSLVAPASTAYGTAIRLDAAGTSLLAPGNAYPAIAGSVALPLQGADVGAWRIAATAPAPEQGQEAMRDLGVLIRYGTPASDGRTGDQVAMLDVAIAVQPGVPLTLYGGFDPTGAPRTRVAFFADDGTGSPPALPATLRTSRGFATKLTPVHTSGVLGSARLVLQTTPALVGDLPPATPAYHLTPDGPFDLTVDMPSGTTDLQQRVMLGLSGQEYANTGTSPARVQFAADQPAFAPAAAPDTPPPPVGDPLLTNAATTAHLTVLARAPGPGNGLTYYAQPRQAPLFGGAAPDQNGYLPYCELGAAPLPAWEDSDANPPPTVPAVPFAGAAPSQAELALRLEHAALSPARRAALGLRPQTLDAGAGTSTLATTPQGLVVDVTAGDIDRVVIANMPATPEGTLDLTGVGPCLQAGIQADQVFTVVADPGAYRRDSSIRYRLGEDALRRAVQAGVPQSVVDAVRAIVISGGQPVDYTTEAAFTQAISAAAGPYLAMFLPLGGQLKAEMTGWKFQLSPPAWRPSSGEAPTIMVLKFAARPLAELIEDTTAWGWQGAAALPGQTIQATRAELRRIVNDARTHHEHPSGPDDPYAAFYRDVVSDPAWNGVLFLNAPVAFDELPDGLQFVAAGIDPRRFYAHHVGFSATPVRIDATTHAIVLDQTAAFGLIDYQDPRDLTLAPDAYDRTPWAFKTLLLSARFANAALASFAARVELMINRLFGVSLAKQDPTHGNNLVLGGSCQIQDGTPAYAFVLEGLNRYVPARSLIENIEVLSVRLHTAGADPAGKVVTRFVLGGLLRLRELDRFDPYAYGSTPKGTGVEDGYLRYDGLAITMTFALERPTEQAFGMGYGTISFDLTNSVARPRSLAARFPVRLTGLVEIAAGAKPEDLGWVSVSAPIQQTPMTPPWFGLTYELDLGTLGTLAGNAGVTLSLLAAWAPGAQDGDRPAYLALRVGGGRTVKSEWPLQGVVKLGFRSFQFVAYDTTDSMGAPSRAYQLLLRRMALSILGISFPPGNADLRLFGNPHGDPKVLGWYAVYTEDDGPPKSVAGEAQRQLVSGRRVLVPGAGE